MANYLGVLVVIASLGMVFSPDRAGAVCGDGLLDPGEACDDGNAEARGWCAADCGAVTGPRQVLYGAGEDGAVYVLDVHTQALVATIPDVASGDYPRLDLRASPDGRLIAAVNQEHDDGPHLSFIATQTNTLDAELSLDPYDLTGAALAFSPDSRTLHLTADEGLILSLDLASLQIDQVFDAFSVECPDGDSPDSLGALVASHDGRYLYASTRASTPQRILAVDLLAGTMQCFALADDETEVGAEYPQLAITPDDKQVFVTSDYSLPWLSRWSTKNGKFVNLSSEDYNPATGLAATCGGGAVYALVAPGPTALSTVDPKTLAYTTGPGLGVDENPKYTAASRDGGTFFWGDSAPDGFSWTDVVTHAVTRVDVGAGIAGLALVTLPEREGDLCAPAPLSGCVQGFAAASLLINERTSGKEKVIAKFAKGPDTLQSDFGDPLRPPCGATAYALCVYNDQDALIVDLGVDRAGARCSAGGAMCWGSVGSEPPNGKGYKYRDIDTAADGVKKLRLRSGVGQRTKMLLKAANAPGLSHLPTGLAAGLAGTSQATMQLVTNDAACFSVDLTTVKRAEATLFKAKR